MRCSAVVSAAADAGLLRLERDVWSELITCLRLSRTVRAAAASAREDDAPPAASSASSASAPPEADGSGGPKEADCPREDAEEEEPVALPTELLALRPPPPLEGWPAGAPTAPLPSAWLAHYPAKRRALRLSYVAAALLPECDQQALLMCESTAERLDELLLQLRPMRERLAALVALRRLG